MASPFHEMRDREYDCYRDAFFTFPPHIHKQVEVLYVTKGTGVIHTGAGPVVMRQGDLAVFFPYMVHSYEEISAGGTVIIAICSDVLAGGMRGLLQTKHPSNPVILGARVHRDIPVAMRMIARQKELDTWACSALLQLVLARAIPQLSLVDNAAADDHDLPYRAVEYVMRNAYDPLTLQAAARALGVSESRLSRTFTGKLGVSFTRYVQQLRVERAKELLASTAEPVLQIGFDCGFENVRSFDRVFAGHCGMSPREWRRWQQQETM